MLINKNDFRFYGNFLSLAVPVMIQSFLAASLNLLDNVMVGQLGDSAIAGVGLGNQVFYVIQLFLIGVSTGASLFSAQFKGSASPESIKRVLGFSLVVSLSLSTLSVAVIQMNPQGIIRLLTDKTDMIRSGSVYLKAVSFSYVLTAFNVCVGGVLQGMKKVRIPMIANAVGIAVNTAGNFLLIFGRFGFPALGVQGAGIATVIARSVETVLLIILVLATGTGLFDSFKDLFVFPKSFLKRFSSISSMLIVKDLIWGVGMTLLMAIYGRMGTEVVASLNIIKAVRHLAFVVFAGFANACLIIVGNSLGADRFKKADRDIRRIISLTFVSGLLFSLLLILLRPLIMAPYNVSQQVRQMTEGLLLICGFLFTANVYNMVAVMGVLRGGGDAAFPLFMDIGAIYLLALPLGLLGHFVWHLDIFWVFALVNLQEFLKVGALFFRIRSGRWRRNIVGDLA